MLILKAYALQMRMDSGKLKKAVPLKGGRELFSEEKVRRGFLTYRIAINRTTRGKPLRLQKLSFLIGLAKLGTPLIISKLCCARWKCK